MIAHMKSVIPMPFSARELLKPVFFEESVGCKSFWAATAVDISTV